jgi:hypothetical protein
MTSGRPYQRQHLVSKVLLKQFADPHLQVLDVTTGEVFAGSPESAGWQRNFIAHEAAEAERRWGEIEARVPAVLAALSGRQQLDDDIIDTLKDAFALHWARGAVLKVIHAELIGPHLREHPELVVHVTDEDFYDRYVLYPAGPGALEVMQHEVLDRALELHDQDEFFAERVHDNFDLMRRNLDDMRMDVGIPDEGEFLISDRPATTKQHGHDGVGPLQGVPWLEADAAVMPLAPSLQIAPADGPGGYSDIPLAGVRELNRLQVVGAGRHIYMRPGSGLLDEAKDVARARPNDRQVARNLLQRYLDDHGY